MQQAINSSQHFEMPDLFRWFLSDLWLEPTRKLNQALGGRVEHWITSMEAAIKDLSPHGGKKALNKIFFQWPYLAAYAAFQSTRRSKMRKRWQEILESPTPRCSEKNAEIIQSVIPVRHRPGRTR